MIGQPEPQRRLLLGAATSATKKPLKHKGSCSSCRLQQVLKCYRKTGGENEERQTHRLSMYALKITITSATSSISVGPSKECRVAVRRGHCNICNFDARYSARLSHRRLPSKRHSMRAADYLAANSSRHHAAHIVTQSFRRQVVLAKLNLSHN